MAVKTSNERTLVTLPKDLKEKLIAMAEQNNRTLSKEICFILQKYVDENYKELNLDLALISRPEFNEKIESLSDAEFRYIIQSLLRKTIEDLKNKGE